MSRRLLIATLACIVATWPLAAKPAGLAPRPPGLSAEQVTRLARGEIVLLDVLPPGGEHGGQGGTAVARVDATADQVWRVLVDFPGHRGLYPGVVDADVLEAAEGHTLVRYVVGVGPFSFGFHVDNYLRPDRRRIEWRLARSRRNDLFRDSWGYWAIEPSGGGVLLTYAMGARTVLPAFLTRGAERDGLVETVKAVRDRVEGRG